MLPLLMIHNPTENCALAAPMEKSDLKSIAEKLTIRGKGILASDESTGTIGKRLEKAGLKNTEVCLIRCFQWG